ncbi:hypothetical protein [Salinispora arenicola]|uniref:hypothetical protein n=1 Tax=Salinispora arenicola TaxID=168697 RepID=UPI00037188E8|nr:hypothetical protein [Salinispora arenicola]
MTNNGTPFDVGEPVSRDEHIADLWERFRRHSTDEGIPALSREELVVMAELLGELNTLLNPGPADTNPLGRLAVAAASRIYSRLGI